MTAASGLQADPDAIPTGGASDPRPAWQPVVRTWRYPIAAATLLLVVGVVLRLGWHASTLPVAAFAAAGVTLATVDAAVMRLPNVLVRPTAAAVAAGCLIQALAEHDGQRLIREVIGAAAAGGFYLLLYVLSRGRGLGGGDIRLGTVAGMVLASHGLRYVLTGTFLAYLVTLAILLPLRLRGRRQFPHGPGLVIGTLATLLLL